MDAKERILQVIGTIPKGKVCTYGMVAKLAGLPGYARYVGTVLKSLPEGSRIPWHRVINSKGTTSFPQGSAQQQSQWQKLAAEGIHIRNGKISLSDYLWHP